MAGVNGLGDEVVSGWAEITGLAPLALVVPQFCQCSLLIYIATAARNEGVMEWSTAAASVWGKLEPESVAWVPLVTHLEQTMEVAGLVWDSFVPPAVKQILASDLGGTDEAMRALCCWYAGVHDVGKASVAFAQQAYGRGMDFVLARMQNAGLSVNPVPRSDHVRHETIGQLALRDWLQAALAFTRRRANTWACVVGGHHGCNPNDSTLIAAENRPHVVGVGLWKQVRVEIIEQITAHTGIRDWLEEHGGSELSIPSQVLLTAIVVVSDWLASNQEYFPYLDPLTPHERAQIAFDEIGLPSPWRPVRPSDDPNAFFRARFPDLGAQCIRSSQKALVEAALVARQAPLLIFEAPMGCGKTEAALLASEVVADRFGQGGVYIGLPTMATANPMFDRVLAWLRAALGEADASVSLAHGKAGLNDTYAGLIRDSWRGHVYDEDDAEGGRPIVNSWLRGRRRAGLASFVVGTIDQGLFAALKAKHVALRHLGLAGKVVIVDEVHAADTYMREYLKRALTWLGAYRTPVILMSATLPPAQREEYIAAYAQGRGDREPAGALPTDVYPRITMYDGGVSDRPIARDEARRAVRVELLADDPVGLVSLLQRLLAEGGCAGVICNTVARAQEAYRALRAEFGDDTVLLHSRFVAPDRAVREGDLVARLGRDGERPKRAVVVGTQVLEQSLDVDFDVLVSDLAPVDLLLQRVGRMHRHVRSRRPEPVAKPVFYIRGVADWDAMPPVAASGSRTVYGEAALLRAAAVVGRNAEIILPVDIPRMVREAYDPALVPPAGWEKRWESAREADAVGKARAKARAQSYLLADPREPMTLTGWLDVPAEDPERSEEQGRSQVRDSEDSLEVLALWRDGDGVLHMPRCAPGHPWAIVPEGLEWGTGSEQSMARALAACTLSLPIQFTNPGTINRAIGELECTVDYSGWQHSPWLKGQLAIVFGPDDHAQLAGFDLHYTTDEGLVVTRLEEKA